MGRLNIRTAARRLLRAPSFALTVSGTLAIAIGAVTAVFSVVYGLLLRPLPFRDPGKLVGVIDHRLIYGHEQDRLSPTDFLEWRRDLRTFDGLAAYTNYPENMTGRLEPVRITAAHVSANWFTLLGVNLEAGRAFAVGDDEPQAQRVVVLSDAIWRRQFGADPHVVGSTVHIDAMAYTVVGIAPRSMTLPNAPDIWLPWVFQPWEIGANARGDMVVRAIGRLAAGVPIARARMEVREVEDRARAQFGDTSTLLKYDVVPLRTKLVGDARPALLVLCAAVGCLLVIACANIANLLLVRAVGREHEIAIRLALGARRADIVKQLVVESALLAMLGGAVGVAFALFGVRVAGPQTTVDATVLAFSAAVTIVSGVVAGLVPALSATNPRPTRGSQRGGRLRGALVVGEIALTMPLLIAAGLLGQSLSRLTDIDPGFRPEHAVRFDVALTASSWDSATLARARQFTDEVVRRLSVLPGTNVAGAADNVPFGSGQHLTWFDVQGRPSAPPSHPNYAQMCTATPGYFASLGIPLLHGRVFTDQDRPNGHLVVVINRALADAIFPGEDPIGKTLTTTSYVDTTGKRRVDDYGEIVGVVGNTPESDLAGTAQQTIYTAFDQAPGPNMTYVVRSSLEARSVLVTARAQVEAVDPTAPVFNAMPLEDAIQASMKRPRTNAWIVGAFSAVALLLASLGIFGVIAFAVRARNREIGIRLALGASSGRVVRLMITQGLALTVMGLFIGVTLSIAGGGIVAGLVYGIKPTDIITYASVSIGVLLVAMTASWIPASRAARVDPTIAMRV